MRIGIIGISRRDFHKFCASNECIRVSETEYKDRDDNRFILVDNYINVCGRMFDKIIDLDPVRWDLVHRVPSRSDYNIGFIYHDPDKKEHGIGFKPDEILLKSLSEKESDWL